MFVARAPGKLVALGEYAVLDGAPAVVLALDRYVEVEVAPSRDGACRLTTRADRTVEQRFAPGESSGAALVDLVTAAAPQLAFEATIDSQALYSGAAKLGLGSSAAVLTAWAGAFGALARSQGLPAPEPDVADLIELHRRFQGGKGSGLDVAAAHTGGAITFRLAGPGMPQIGSVRLPNSVGFAGIFAGRSASTPELVAHYRAWRRDRPREAAALAAPADGAGGSGVRGAARGGRRGMARRLRGLRARLAGPRGRDRCRRRHGRASRDRRRSAASWRCVQGQRRRRRRSRPRLCGPTRAGSKHSGSR